MTHTLIDGRNIYDTFGATISPDSFGNILKYPAREAVHQTDFAESHGIQADLRFFRLQRRRLQLTFSWLAMAKQTYRRASRPLLTNWPPQTGIRLTLGWDSFSLFATCLPLALSCTVYLPPIVPAPHLR